MSERPSSLSRRGFFQTAAAASAGAALSATSLLAQPLQPPRPGQVLPTRSEPPGPGQAAGLPPAPNPMKRGPRRFHVDYCAFEKPLEKLSYDELGETMAGLGLKGIEATVRKGGHVDPAEVETQLPKLVEALKKHDVTVKIIATGINAATPEAEKVLATAAQLGITHYRMDWWKYDLKKPLQLQLDGFTQAMRGLLPWNAKHKLTALYQNHAGEGMVGAAVWDIFSIIRNFPPELAAIAFDIRHATVEGGLSWPNQFYAARSHIGAAYVKDFIWENKAVKNVPLGEGMVNRKFFTMLKEIQFSGPVSLHVEYVDGKRPAADVAAAFKKDFATLQEWMPAE